jgi:hypothetical protein
MFVARQPFIMKKLTLGIYIIITLFTSSLLHAQKVDIGIMAAGTHYYGDVVNELSPTSIRAAGAGFIRYRLNNYFALKAFGMMGKVAGDDKLSSSQWQNQRNWSFETLLMEGSMQIEWNLVEDRNNSRKLKNSMIPYVFTGIGAFYFKPQTQLADGRLQSTAPLMLSGVKYQQIAMAIPLGIGFRYYLNKKWLIGGELSIRYTTTSYIDDIGNFDRYASAETTPFPKATRYFQSQRSSTNHQPGDLRGKMGQGLNVNDMYAIFGVNIAYNLNKSKGANYGGRRQLGCPRFY